MENFRDSAVSKRFFERLLDGRHFSVEKLSTQLVGRNRNVSKARGEGCIKLLRIRSGFERKTAAADDSQQE